MVWQYTARAIPLLLAAAISLALASFAARRRRAPAFVVLMLAFGLVVIRVRGQVVGFLSLASQTPGFYRQADAELLQAFADQTAAAIENPRLYEEVSRHARELELPVAERTAELQAANDSLAAPAERLKELDQLKSEFVSNVSHELRTPLTNIETYLYLLDKGKAEKSAHYVATLRREANLLRRLIEDLLYLTWIDLRRVQPALKPVDVNSWFTQPALEANTPG
jgi:signal transduction histidine kinase